MKRFFLVSLILLASACEERENAFDSLSSAERDNVARKYSAQCISETNSDFNSFESDSNDNVYGTWTREDSWKFEKTQDGATSAAETHTISVWKNDGTDLYLIVKIVPGLTYKFIKIPKTTNSEMIDDLQTSYCAKTLDYNPSASGGTINKETTGTADSNGEYTNNIDVLTISSSYPVYFGALSGSSTQKVLDEDDDSTVSSVKYNYTISALADVSLSSDYTTYSSTNFCEVTSSGASPNTFTIPYTLTCVAAVPGTWDLTP
ncbi:MAG: hypothetical protein AB7I27_06800 [Bacteriovoracaceae bacterium]